MNGGFVKMLGEDKSFELFKKMMTLALDDPNAIANISMKILVSLSKLNDDSTEEFEKVLNHMREEYASLPSLDGVVILSILRDVLSESDLANIKVIIKDMEDE